MRPFSQWAVIVINKKTFSLREYHQADARAEAREFIRMWKQVYKEILPTVHVYLARTDGF